MAGSACVQVVAGDRLGFLSEGPNEALGYTFLETGGHALVYSLQNNTPPKLGQHVTADQLAFPYLFELAAAIDQG